MDFLFFSQTIAILAFLTFLILLYSLLLVSRNVLRIASKKKGAPEAGGAWPLIGHLHLLGGSEPAHRVLGNMADKYGPIFTIRMGVHRTLVVSSWEIAKECLTTNDKVFANRPKTLAMEILGYNSTGFGFSPYGPFWRQARKVATLELLSNYRLEKLKHVRESEVKNSLKELWVKYKSTSSEKVLVEMRRWFKDITLNVVLKIILGKQRNSGEEYIAELMSRFFELTGKFVVSDALPFLRWLDIGGDERVMKKTAKELDAVVQRWLEEHKKKRDSGAIVGEEDFMDVMLSSFDDAEQFPGHDLDNIIKATSVGLTIAAADTTTATMTWVLSLLINHPDVLKKAQNELDIQIGRGRVVNESDLKNLVYFQAIIKEAMRLYPAGPLLIPHESLEDCTVSGYRIPAGTRLFVNAWKLHRDPRVWEEPCKFQPERFLNVHRDIDVKGQNFELIPFGSGRRMCPGVSFALQMVQHTLASLLQGFHFETLSDEAVDMAEGIGMTMPKATPLEVLLTPRLSSSLYD